MLVAEVHGKSLPDVADSEDYLTSAVFGHLRYLPPSVFWPSLLARTKGCDAGESSLGAALARAGHVVTEYASLDISFWRQHLRLGEPDLVLRFSGGSQPPLLIVIEVKLWSGKSGCGGSDDQLCRYLRLLDDTGWLGDDLSGMPAALIYLTPRDSLAEAEESLRSLPEPASYRSRLYRLQWQDVLATARESAAGAAMPHRMILADVAEFLSRRQLEYFAGYRCFEAMPLLGERDGAFYEMRHSERFRGMRQLPSLDEMPILRGGWVQ